MEKLMKTAIFTALFGLSILSNSAFAGVAKSTNYVGKAKISLRYYSRDLRTIFLTLNSKDSSVDILLNANLIEGDNGLATLRLSSNGVQQCAGLAVVLYAEQDGFNGYDLFTSKENWLAGVKVGSIRLENDKLHLIFNDDNYESKTVGRSDSGCVFKFKNNFHSSLNRYE
jgi:hypothetical protein